MPSISSVSSSSVLLSFDQAQNSVASSSFTPVQKDGLLNVLEGYRSHPNPSMRNPARFNAVLRPIATTELMGYAMNGQPNIKIDDVHAQLPDGQQVANATVTNNGQEEKITTVVTSEEQQQLHRISAERG
jgi:hypothetical protein